MGGQGQENSFQDARTHPVLEASMDGLVRAVSVGQILPGRAGAQDPQHPVEDPAAIAPRSAAAVGAYRIFGEDGFDEIPLFIGDVHPPLTIHNRAKYNAKMSQQYL